MSSVETYKRWFDYEKDSHAKVLKSFDSVPERLGTEKGMQTVIDLMAHVVAARMMWLYRFGVVTNNTELFPRNTRRDALPFLITEMESVWFNFLSQLNEAGLARVFEYQSHDGLRFRNTVEDILTQLFGHSWYHRGQIAALIRSLGGEPAVTDFVFWAREPVATNERR